MTKISKKAAYPVKIPVRKDYFVGTDSENNVKTVNFEFESTAKLINELNGTPILNYIFRTDSNIDLTVLTEGVFLSAENETTIANISKLYINKNNFHETNMSDLFRFVSVNRESFLMKLRNSSNLSNSVYFRITDATEFESYFILDVAVEMNNASLPELTNFNVYFFDFELSSSDLAITLPEFNKIVAQTGYTSTETTITFNPSWTWLIKNVSYENSASVVKTIAPTTTGKKRIDVFVLNTSNTFETISGEETTGSPVKPQIPADTLEVTFCIVGDTGIDSVEPIDLSSYATIDYVNTKDALLSDRITTLEEGDSGVGLPIAITDVTGLTAELAVKVTQTEIDSLGSQLLGGATSDANTLKELNDKILAVQAIIGGTTADGDALVNTVAELLAVFATFPEGVDLVTLLAGKVNTTDVYNTLDCIVAGKVADARQLKVLNDLIVALTATVGGKENTLNKTDVIAGNETSSSLYASIKGIIDWLTDTKIRSILGISTLSGSNTGDETTATLKTKIFEELAYACSDETSNLTVGNLISFRVPFAMTLSEVRISLNDAPTVSSVVVDVKESGTSIFSTLLSIDASELTSVTAAVPAVISDVNLADDALLTVSTTQIGSGNTGKGLKIVFKGKRA